MKNKDFKPNRKFRKDYNRLFKKDPAAANALLLLCELADEKGQIFVKDEMEIAELLAARFEDPKEYSL